MKCSNTAFILSLATFLVGTSAQCPELIWSDEFDGNSLDMDKWSYEVGDGCDKGEGMCGWGNNEWQFYTSDGSNVVVSDGTLKIWAKYDATTQAYTSARLSSKGKANFDLSKPRRIEAKIKLPDESYGLWPAFWMMPSLQQLNTWPKYGEIDIMEYIGREPNQTYACAHYGETWNDKSHKCALMDYKEHGSEWFHDFVLESTGEKLEWFVNGHKIFALTPEDIEPKFDWPFESVFHLILNLAVGGNWPQYPDITTQFPAVLEVDYVRVYDLATSEEPTPEIIGDKVVPFNKADEDYCIEVGKNLVNGQDYDILWWVPDDATFVAHPNKPDCIRVQFGVESGYVEATVLFYCERTYQMWLPIEVKDRYKTDYRFWAGASQATYVSSTGVFSEHRDNSVVSRQGAINTSPATITYQRDLTTVYDRLIYSTNAIPDPQLFVESARKFFLDVKSATAAPCTRIFIQLEDSSLATEENYPVGRHSRYLALLPKDDDYQKLEFDFYDTPDATVAKVDRIVILIDSFVQRADTYYLRNFVSASAGCTNGCLPFLDDNECQIPAKSEEGACTDGFNNDGFGWNGDGTTDCADSDCYMLDPACMNPTTLPPLPVPEICNDGIDNDGNGYIDCEDFACATSPLCGSWWNPSCEEYSACAEEGHVGDCCPDANGNYKECCEDSPTPASCSVNPECSGLGLSGDCCPSADGVYLDCCQPQLCQANPRCSGLEGACCPTAEGVFLDCCEDKPQTCDLHPQCEAQGLTGECCPTPDGEFLDCCKPAECTLHPSCNDLGLEGTCCPTPDGVFLDCCNLDLPQFDGFTGIFVATPEP